jgi:hypothetical protein
MTDWQPIDSVPRGGTPVQLRSKNYAPRQPLWWNAALNLWEGLAFAVAGATRVCWDETLESPTEWKAISPSKTAREES